MFEEFSEKKRFYGFWKAVYYTWTDLPFVRFFWEIIWFFQKAYAYAPLIWRDNDYDFAYLLTLMEFKLRRMGEHVIEHDIAVNAKETGKEILIAAELCKRINKDDYSSIPLAKLTEEYGEVEWNSEPIENRHAHRIILDRVKAREGTPEYEVVKAKERRIFKAAEQQRERDKEYLFKLLNKKIDHWWC